MTSPWLIPGVNARLIELHPDSALSFRDIAARLNEEFGAQLTRYACIGRAYRLGLPKRPSPSPPVKQEIMEMREPDQIPIEAIEIVAPKPLLDGVSIYDLNGDSCRFVLDDVESKPPFTYCGKAAGPNGGSWCKAHYARVYVGRRAA